MKSKIIAFFKTWSLRIIFVAIILSIVFFFISKGEETTEEYILLGTVEQGDITVSIAESGQVSDAEEIELKPDASAKITHVYVDEGSYVSKGQILLSLDASDALLNVEDAKISLEQAQQDLEELREPADEIDIKKAKISIEQTLQDIEELGEPADEIDIKKAKNSITEAENKITALSSNYDSDYADLLKLIEETKKTDLPSAFNSAYSEITNVFIDLPEAYAEIKDIVQGSINGQRGLAYYSTRLGREGRQQQSKVENDFSKAQSYYSDAIDLYEGTSREDTESLEELVDTTYEAVSALSNTLKELDVFLALFYGEDPDDSYMLVHRKTTAENIAVINPYLSSVYTEVEAIDDLYQKIEDAEQDIIDLERDYEIDLNSLNLTLEEKQLDLDELLDSDVDETDLNSLNLTLEEKQLDLDELLDSDADDLEYRTQELVVRQRKNSLASAQKDYEDYFLHAPVAGYISSWDVDFGESVSSSTTIGTLIDDNKQVVVSLNELDILDVKLGQTATITFDAIPDFEAEGVVLKKDIAGTVNSGVVSYNVTLSIQSEDERILTGMSADVDIVLLSKPDTTIVSKVSVKEDKQGKYVEVIKNSEDLDEKPFFAPEEVEIENIYFEVGEEDDVNYQVLSGLEIGTRIVLSTISLSTDNDESSGFGLPGAGGGGGGFTPPSGGGGGNFGGGSRPNF